MVSEWIVRAKARGRRQALDVEHVGGTDVVVRTCQEEF